MIVIVLSILFLFTLRSISCGSCGPPEVPLFMKITPNQRNYTNGSSVVYFCRYDKFLIGNGLRTCLDGNWHPLNRVPLCGNIFIIIYIYA